MKELFGQRLREQRIQHGSVSYTHLSHSLWKSNRTHSDSGEVFKKEDGIEMYFNSGYLNNSRLDFKDYTKPLVDVYKRQTVNGVTFLLGMERTTAITPCPKATSWPFFAQLVSSFKRKLMVTA